MLHHIISFHRKLTIGLQCNATYGNVSAHQENIPLISIKLFLNKQFQRIESSVNFDIYFNDKHRQKQKH